MFLPPLRRLSSQSTTFANAFKWIHSAKLKSTTETKKNAQKISRSNRQHRRNVLISFLIVIRKLFAFRWYILNNIVKYWKIFVFLFKGRQNIKLGSVQNKTNVIFFCLSKCEGIFESLNLCQIVDLKWRL